MDKLNSYFEKIADILNWAEDQGHITEDANKVLHDAFLEAKEEIEA